MLKGAFISDAQTGNSTGLGSANSKRKPKAVKPSAEHLALLKEKRKRKAERPKGRQGNVRCPRCGVKFDRSQLDQHLSLAHGL
jgi:hypothetical protein